MTSVPTQDLVLTSSTTLSWYRSSPRAERGFCRVCGGNLFWRPDGENRTAITAGTLDLPTGLELAEHIFVDDKSDYYVLDDGLPQRRQ